MSLAAPGDGRTPEELVREADTAMYRAKGAGRDRYEVFDDIMRAEVADRVAIAQELRHALERDELVLEFQPMVGVSDGSLAACEALLRWHHPERGDRAAAVVHPAGRGERADRPHRRVGAARGLPPGRGVAPPGRPGAGDA